VERLEKFGLALFIYSIISLAVNAYCNAAFGSHYGTSPELLVIGLICFTAGKRANKA